MLPAKIDEPAKQWNAMQALTKSLFWRNNSMADANSTPVKSCTKCGQVKRHSEFGTQRSAKDGLKCACRSCRQADSAAYYYANLEKIKDAAAKSHASNPEKGIRRAAAWVMANPEKAKATKSKYRAANLDKTKAYVTAWKKANPKKVRAHLANRRAKKQASGGKLSSGLVDRLFKLQRGLCACGCGGDLRDGFHLDHNKPLALGGANEDSNCQLLTPACNLSKGAKCPIEWAQSRGLLL